MAAIYHSNMYFVFVGAVQISIRINLILDYKIEQLVDIQDDRREHEDMNVSR